MVQQMKFPTSTGLWPDDVVLGTMRQNYRHGWVHGRDVNHIF